MTPKHDVIDRIRAALRSEARIRDTGEPIRLGVTSGDLLIEGEVDRIAGICFQANPKSATTAFRQVFHQLAPKSPEPSGIDSLEQASPRWKRYRWEEKNA